jgi:hypothetical protein
MVNSFTTATATATASIKPRCLRHLLLLAGDDAALHETASGTHTSGTYATSLHAGLGVDNVCYPA